MAGIKDTKIIKGQPHLLTYITPNEVEKLKALGGQETMTPEGIPAYPEFDNYTESSLAGTSSAGSGMSRSEFEGGAYSGTGSAGDGVIDQYNTSSKAPPKKPIPTKKNKVNEGFIKNYFNNHPFYNALNKFSKNKFNTKENAKARTRYLEKLKKEDPEQYRQIVGDLKKVNYVEEGVEFYGPESKGAARDIETFTDLGEEQAKTILGPNYQDYLDSRFPGGGGGDGNPNILPQYAMMGGGADLGSEDAVEDVEDEYDYHLGLGGQKVGRDVTLGYLADGGRAGKAEGGIMELRARRAFGGIMDRVTGRKAYGLGSIFKSVKKAAGKVLSSDIGKAAIIGAGIYYGGGGRMPFTDAFKAKGFGGFSLGPSTGGFFSKQNPLLFSAGTGKNLGKQVFNPWKMAGLITAGGALMGPAKVDTLPGMNNRGGSLIDPITGKPAKPAEMRASLNNALDNADGDPIRIKQINDAYAFLGPDERLGTYLPYRTYGVKDGGRIGKAEGGLMDLGGMEKDYRAEGGFVPIGEYEKKDDVPARLSVNEFVFTADAVRGAGQGDIDKGAEIMENMMKNLEKGGTISEESQGNIGAQQMFNTSERLGEVI
jgi:hypothetical protein